MNPLKKSDKAPSVIVFGGSGFLGSHVADALTHEGYQVRIFDLKRSEYLQPDQEMVIGDILDAAAVEKAVQGCDYVYNFAGIADLDDATTKPMDTIQLNIAGNNNIMNAAVSAKVKRFIYASTIYVYSERGGFYRCSKQAAELYLEEYQRQHGLDFTILRYSTLYGPRADDRNAIHRYLKQAITSGAIQCVGGGEEVRDYVHVRDAARLSAEILDEKYKNKHVIISGNHPVKYREMLMMIKEILGGEIKIDFSTLDYSNHYNYTPYSFTPKIAHKLTHHLYLDMGQGLLECVHQIHNELMAKDPR